MAAAETGRELYYYTWGQETFADELKKCYKVLQSFQVTVSQLWNLLLEYCDFRLENESKDSLFSWLQLQLIEK